jgi:uncharacterized cupin superfamily protein
MNKARFEIQTDNDEYIVIKDTGHTTGRTVTNDAHAVVEELADRLNGRRLFYYDSDNQLDELAIKDGKFAGFKAGPPHAKHCKYCGSTKLVSMTEICIACLVGREQHNYERERLARHTTPQPPEIPGGKHRPPSHIIK